MKHAGNKEMDLLLRNMAKQAKSVSDSGNGLQSAHLDADELSAFAERALPPAAQARYTAHLVDCGQCRKLVAQLSAAAGFPVAEMPAEAQQPKTSFWERLPAFLSPAVLRFAVPALAMLAVISVGVITFRQQSSGEFVAQTQEPTQNQPVAASEPNGQPSEGNVQTQNQSPAATTLSNANADSVSKAGEKSVPVDKVTAAETGASGDTASATVAAKEAPAPPAPSKAGEEQSTFAPEPSPLAKAQVAATREANKNEAPAKDAKGKEDAALRVGAQPATAAQVRDGADQARDAYISRSRKAAAAGRGGAATNSVESRRAETEQAKRADQDDVTREVSGHRFRKQGNAWVDLAYDGRSVTTVARGSEQYRALIADEPGIHTIAQRFSGEVLIVWNGRAYRIR